MSSRNTHDVVGIVAGAGWTVFKMPEQQAASNAVARIAGGALGGYFGSMLPDLIEPATTPNHRSVAHSFGAAGSGAMLNVTALQNVQQWATMRSAEFARQSQQCSVSGDARGAQWCAVMELAMQFLAGVATGVVPGYLSHLACDLTTPRGLPLLVRGF